MKKVLVLNLTPRLGMLHYSSQFCNELSKYVNLKVAIADYYAEDLYNGNIEFIKIKTNPTAKDFVFNTLAFWRHINFICEIRKFKPEIVHFIDNHPWYSFYAKIFKLFGYEIYTTQHDPTLHSGENTSLLGKVAINVNRVLREKSDKIFVHGDKLKEEVTKQYGVSTEKVVSIVHGNFNFLKDKYSKGGEILKNNFLFFGRIVDYKGLDLLLDSLEQIKKEIPNFRLTIAGPGSLENYKNQIEKFKENISVYNFSIDAKDNYKYFETCEFVVLPYKDATGSGVVPAAYAFYKSVIVTNVGELANAVENGKTGIILEEKSIAELAESIIFMLKNKEKVIEMGKEGRKYSESVLGWKGVVEKCYFKTP